jgi:transcriptional regulator with AAA-type ATPase domain
VLSLAQKTEQTISASVQSGAVVTSFETLIGYNDGLKVAIQQAKAAILYPPRGLHTLLCGPSGVGKTTIARLMHAFAIEQEALLPDAPFISFNCADYTGNTQLLLAHLFGSLNESDGERKSLVEQAHRGVLFLDEVHRLPPEGQEMLFYLMDHEHFRRLGDVQERHTSLLLLAATTEDPYTALLPTFRRRFPMLITLPGLEERTLSERYELLRAFFTTECSTIGTNIHIVPQALRALLLYECPQRNRRSYRYAWIRYQNISIAAYCVQQNSSERLAPSSIFYKRRISSPLPDSVSIVRPSRRGIFMSRSPLN